MGVLVNRHHVIKIQTDIWRDKPGQLRINKTIRQMRSLTPKLDGEKHFAFEDFVLDDHQLLVENDLPELLTAKDGLYWLNLTYSNYGPEYPDLVDIDMSLEPYDKSLLKQSGEVS